MRMMVIKHDELVEILNRKKNAKCLHFKKGELKRFMQTGEDPSGHKYRHKRAETDREDRGTNRPKFS